jgi:valyl-tRNA synthetase
MLGKNIFYPFGTDDNGLATNTLIEKTKKVKARNMSRSEFVKLCNDTLDKELRPKYIENWKKIGMSCDFSIFYSTINKYSQKISQASFIDLYKKKRVYRKEAPIIWCTKCETALAQVELEDKAKQTKFVYIEVKTEDNKSLTFATTRPELYPSCVGMSVNPDDKRYKNFVGKTATMPITNAKIQITTDEMIDPDFGTGVVYFCSSGDVQFLDWETRHPVKDKIYVVNKNGTMNEKAGKYKGLSIMEAREKIVEDLKKLGVVKKVETRDHVVNVHERCKTDIEYVSSEEWFIRYLDLKGQFLKNGNELNWFPHHMKNRYDNWVKGLKWDWCISRQRFFGVPFPVWYCKKCKEVMLAEEKDLPVDPLKDKPSKKCKCGSSEFEPEKDVLDTWATSSLTPNLAIDLFKDKPIYKKLFPMSLRPQAHDIITFWLFNTVVKSQLHFKKNPWKDVVISGHALDPKGRKMSKSLGNIVEPHLMIEKYSADALRFWAAGSKLGDDLPFQEKDLVTGQKFIIKLWNACRFAFMNLNDFDNKKVKNLFVMDKWILSKLSRIIKSSTDWFDKYEYVRTKADVENFFWHTFADNYLEIIKDRIYNPDKNGIEAKKSAQYSLYLTLSSVIKMIAPIMPHITEELYQDYFKKFEKDKSIHTSKWPSIDLIDEKSEKIGDFFISVLLDVRRAKSEKNLSMKKPVKKLIAKGKITETDFNSIRDDLVAVTNSEIIEFERLKPDSKIDYEAVIDI